MELKRVLTLRTIVSMSAGLALASSTFVAMVQVASFVAGESAWIAILVAGLLALTAAFSFGEMNGMYPSAAAIRVYLSKGYNDTLSLIISFLYILIILAVLGTEAFILSQALAYAIPAIPALAWNMALLVLVTALNLRGITLAGKFQDVVTYGLVLSLIGTSLWAFTRPGFRLEALVHPGSFDGFLQAVALGVFLYIGFEWVTPLSEEVTQVRLVPKGMMLALGLLGVTYALAITAFTGTVDKGLLSSVPIPQILFGEKLLGSPGILWMLLLSIAATTKTFNAGFTAASRFLYATAREGALPGWFAKLHLRYFTPQNALLFLFVTVLFSTIAIHITKRYTLLLTTAAALESIVYVLVAVAVIRLRKKEPETPRPFKAPWVPWLPGFTALAFGFLAVGALLEDLWAAVVLLGTAGVVSLYTWKVVPVLRKKAEEERAQRRSSRRRRATDREM